ncbi:MAG: pantetheine-phosphate adenylyltransferase [Bacteroidetes bacterium]|nr:pantetheine-phosphate adenylyltransferase [Bacteroidota bacterium]
MQRIAVFPGSFDPITRGHESVIKRALPLFDQLIVAIGENGEKKTFFPLERRLGWLKQVFGNDPRIRISTYSGLTIDFCRREKATFILRGLRTSADFEFERGIGQMNKMMYPEVETVFFLCAQEYASVSSSIVRDILRHGGDVRQFVPEGILI